MPNDLLSLANQLEKLTGQLEDAANEKKQEVATVIVRDLLYSTPVDTSKAVSNYKADLGAAVAGVAAPFSPGQGGTTRDASISAALAEAMAVISKSKPGQAIVLSNWVEYLQYLNDGSSQQAAAGFVEAAVFKGRKHAESTGLEIR